MPPNPASPMPTQVRIPPVGPDTVYCTLFHREPGFAALAEAELFALGGGYAPETGVWLSPVPIRWVTCGYGTAGGRQLAFAPTLEGLAQVVAGLGIVAPRFSITARRLPRFLGGASEARKRIGDCIAGHVSVEDPQLRLELVVSALGYRLLVAADVEAGESDWLGAGHRPHNLPVSLPFRIAQAMLNLTLRPGDTVLDPFCGTGTIPLLASWAGHPSFGSDISAACVKLAAANVAHFGRDATFVCSDARQAQQQADCIVTNLPYGLYSHTSADALPAIFERLGRLAPRATFVTSEEIRGDLTAGGYAIEQVIAVESERFQRFVYVSRRPGFPSLFSGLGPPPSSVEPQVDTPRYRG